jgi:hypothetical protein
MKVTANSAQQRLKRSWKCCPRTVRHSRVGSKVESCSGGQSRPRDRLPEGFRGFSQSVREHSGIMPFPTELFKELWLLYVYLH